MKERNLRLPDNNLITDAKIIDELLRTRQALQNQRNTTSPSEVVRGIDPLQITLERVNPQLVGTIETSFDGSSQFRVPLYEIPDMTIDLTPEAIDLPRNMMYFILNHENGKVLVCTYFNETIEKYWEVYGDSEQIETIVRGDLLTALKNKKWHLEWYNAWSVAK